MTSLAVALDTSLTNSLLTSLILTAIILIIDDILDSRTLPKLSNKAVKIYSFPFFST